MASTPLRPPLVLLALPPLPSFRHAFTRTGVRARPAHLTGYSPELEGHVKPIDFCSCQDSRARTSDSPDPTVCNENDGLLGLRSRLVESLRRTTQPSCHASGVVRFLENDSDNPQIELPQADLDLPRHDRLGHLLSSIGVMNGLEQTTHDGRADPPRLPEQPLRHRPHRLWR